MRYKSSLKFVIFFVIFAIFINLPFARESVISKSLRSSFETVVYPVKFVVYKTFTGIYYVFSSISSLRKAEIENERLIRELKIERTINNQFEALAKENAGLRQFAGFKNKNPYNLTLVGAEIVSRGVSNWFNIVEIDKGKKDGIKTGKAVLTEKGLIGRIIEIGARSSKVLLITDFNSNVSAVISRTNHLGVIAGMQEGPLEMKFIPHGADIRQNDIAVTSGISDFFPKGIPIGFVSHIEKKEFDLFQNIQIESFEDISKINYVFVVR